MGTRKTEDERKAARRWAGVDPARSRQMALVRGKDTAPEMVVRRLAHGLGHRFRLHRKDLPGKPDLVIPSSRRAIFVHGMFLARPRRSGMPTCPRAQDRDRVLDAEDQPQRRAGLRHRSLSAGRGLESPLTVWECETPVSKRAALIKKISRFLKKK